MTTKTKRNGEAGSRDDWCAIELAKRSYFSPNGDDAAVADRGSREEDSRSDCCCDDDEDDDSAFVEVGLGVDGFSFDIDCDFARRGGIAIGITEKVEG